MSAETGPAPLSFSCAAGGLPSILLSDSSPMWLNSEMDGNWWCPFSTCTFLFLEGDLSLQAPPSAEPVSILDTAAVCLSHPPGTLCASL